ncbi:MAG: leucyl aminopeptidase [Candidatus Bathyarchaeia archaeon]
MEVNVKPFSALREEEFPIVAVGIFENQKTLTGLTAQLDQSLDGLISKVLEAKDFSGKLNQTQVLYAPASFKSRRIMLHGLGKEPEFSLDMLRQAASQVALRCRDFSIVGFAFLVSADDAKLRLEDAVEAAVEGCEMALYKFTKYLTDAEKIPTPVTSATFIVSDNKSLTTIRDTVTSTQIKSEAVRLARDIANTPSNDMTPTVMSEIARQVSEKTGLTITVLGGEDMEKEGLGGLLGVSRGSHQPPRFMIMEYRGASEGEPPIAIVGKAVTFDSGGISIKPSEKMEEMKFDKSGGAAVIATMQAVAQLKLPLNVVALVPAAENLPGGAACKPGDVLHMYGGKTAEVINTDAEGRLILADALAYVAKYKPQAIIDVATLTGACVVALGAIASGLFANDEKLAEKVKIAADATGERVWQLPLWKEYAQQIKSEVADMKNVGGRAAGAVTAALFLSNFVGDTPWVHLDIAGTAWTQEGSLEKAYNPKGATGVGVRLLLKLFQEWKN